MTVSLAQTGYIYIHKDASNQPESPDFPFSVSSPDPTFSQTYALNDQPTSTTLNGIGVTGNGGFYAADISGTTYFRPLNSATFSIVPGFSSFDVDGGPANTAIFVTASLTVSYFNGTTFTDLGMAGARDVAFDKSGTNRVFCLQNVYAGEVDQPVFYRDLTSGGWINTGILARQIDVTPTGRLLYTTLSGEVLLSDYDGANPVSLGNVSAVSPGAYVFVTAADDGVIYASAPESAANAVYHVYRYTGAYASGGSWVKEESSKDCFLVTGGLAGQVWGITRDGRNIFSRTAGGFWIADERVRSAPNSNSVMIPVAAGTYAVAETPPANWSAQAIDVYDPSNNSSVSVASGSASVNVGANEVVHLVFKNGQLQPVAQTGYIYIHKDASNQPESPDFPFSVSSPDPTFSQTYALNDQPTSTTLNGIGVTGNGGFYAADISGTTYFRPLNSATFSIVPGFSSFDVDGGPANTAIFVTTGLTVSYFNGTTFTDLGMFGARDVAFDKSGTNRVFCIQNYYASDVDQPIFYRDLTSGDWISTGIQAKQIDVTPTGRLLYTTLSGEVFLSDYNGSNVVSLGKPSPSVSGSYVFITVADDGVIYAAAESTTNSSYYVHRYMGGYASGGSWVKEESSKDCFLVTGGLAGQVWGVTSDTRNILTRTAGGYWINDERVRSSPTSNSVMIPVPAGTYAVAETPPANWTAQAIEVYDPSNNSSVSLPTGSASVNVAANEVVHLVFKNGRLQPSSPDLTPIIYARLSTVYNTTNITVVVDVFELLSVPTSGLITVKVPKDARFALTFNQSATSVGGRSVQNSAWTYQGLIGGSYTFTTTNVIAGNVGTGKLTFGMSGTLTPGATTGTLTVSSVIVGGSGGEIRIDNNNDADKIDYFQQ